VTHYVLGVPATLLAGVGGSMAFQQDWGTATFILCLVSPQLSAAFASSTASSDVTCTKAHGAGWTGVAARAIDGLMAYDDEPDDAPCGSASWRTTPGTS